ncbi:MAG: hypothetical protein OXG35_16980, partial [Acidobacteria bacterium]|nr:hypothetical protein [Acidobacteriota bacterium]
PAPASEGGLPDGPGYRQIGHGGGFGRRGGLVRASLTRWRYTHTLDIFLDIFNVTNRGNFNNPTGDMRSSNFLNLTSLWAGSGFPRQAQFGIRWGY